MKVRFGIGLGLNTPADQLAPIVDHLETSGVDSRWLLFPIDVGHFGCIASEPCENIGRQPICHYAGMCCGPFNGDLEVLSC